jgi:hypothetical protein
MTVETLAIIVLAILLAGIVLTLTKRKGRK